MIMNVKIKIQTVCSILRCKCKYGYKEDSLKCKSMNERSTNLYNLFWLILIIPLIGICICVKKCCRQTLKNQRITSNGNQAYVNRPISSNVYTLDRVVVSNNNNVLGSHPPFTLSSQIIPSAPRDDPPPTYQQAMSQSNQRSNHY